MKYIKLVIERTKFAAGKYDLEICNHAEVELAQLVALIKELSLTNELANGHGLGAWEVNSELQTRIDEVLKWKSI